MGTLIIKMPSRTAADQVEHWIDLPCAYARPAADGSIEREGVKPLSALAIEISAARRLVMMIAASDVTVLRVRVPPLSAAQLQRALPSLVEDSLLSEPSECVIVAGRVEDGWCTVAVVQRIWLELLSRTVNAYGATAVVAVPTQLCLASEANAAVAAVTEDEQEIIFRTDAYEGFGVPIELLHLPDSPLAARNVLESIITMMPGRQAHFYVPQRRLEIFQSILDQMPEWALCVVLTRDNWRHWVKGMGEVEMNLLTGAANAAVAHRRDWRSRRLLYALAGLAILVNIVGLNVEVGSIQREADRLRAGMTASYRTAFPQDKVIVDPLLQMQRRVADAERAHGNPAPDDFLALLARFGNGWSSAKPGTVAASFIAGLEYRERTLIVALQPGNSATMEKLQATQAAHHLLVSQSDTDSWQIRNMP
jgi:general secretion pathway protein L